MDVRRSKEDKRRFAEGIPILKRRETLRICIFYLFVANGFPRFVVILHNYNAVSGYEWLACTISFRRYVKNAQGVGSMESHTSFSFRPQFLVIADLYCTRVEQFNG